MMEKAVVPPRSSDDLTIAMIVTVVGSVAVKVITPHINMLLIFVAAKKVTKLDKKFRERSFHKRPST
jgi:hypothetical protein